MSRTAPSLETWSANGRIAFAAILFATAVLRLAHLLAVADAPFVGQLALDSQEYDRWAREILAGGSGDGAFFQAPLYPYVLAALYALFTASPVVAYLAQIVAAVGACAALVACGRRLAGERTGLLAGMLFAVYLPFWFHDVQLFKESFAVSAVCLLLLLLVEARRGERSWPWWCAGLVAGLLALLRENMLLVVPFLLPLVWRHDLSRRTVASRALRLLVGFALPLFPVLLHNGILAKRSGAFLPTTSQGGVNFWIGNNPQADGTYRPLVPGKQIPAYEQAEARRLAEQAEGRELTPAEVSGYWLRRALAWAKAEPLAFARLQLRKVGLYWSRYEWPDAVDYYWMKSISPPLRLPGLEFFPAALLALAGLFFVRRELALWSPVLLFELGWMVTTVAFFLFSRYRLPAVPGLLLLAAVAIERTTRLWRSERRGAALVATAAITVVWSIPHLAPFPPRRDLVEFNLGRLAEERGDRAAATAHYERALAADPRNLLALLNLGTLAARSGDLATALPRFETAVAVAPDSDDAWANLGATCLAGGDLDGARRALNRALELNPENRFALHNRALLEKRSAPPG